MADMWNAPNMIMSAVGALTAIGTAWLTVVKISRSHHEAKALAKAEILQAAKEEVASLKREIEAKFMLIENKIDQVKESTEQDFSHLKETHGNEMENLSEKLELLRDDLKNQHSQIMTLMTNLLDRKD